MDGRTPGGVTSQRAEPIPLFGSAGGVERGGGGSRFAGRRELMSEPQEAASESMSQEPQFVVDVVVPDLGHGFHVSNMKLDELFFEARNAYINHLGIDDLWHHDVTPQLKELLIRFESEA